MSTVGAVSLNRCEQALFEYVEKHPEERQFWLNKVQGLTPSSSMHLAADRLEIDLWRYFLERASVVPALRDFVRHHGSQRTSMRNLAEYWIRLWASPKRPVAKAPESLN